MTKLEAASLCRQLGWEPMKPSAFADRCESEGLTLAVCHNNGEWVVRKNGETLAHCD
jgi:hypothetical protein